MTEEEYIKCSNKIELMNARHSLYSALLDGAAGEKQMKAYKLICELIDEIGELIDEPPEQEGEK